MPIVRREQGSEGDRDPPAGRRGGVQKACSERQPLYLQLFEALHVPPLYILYLVLKIIDILLGRERQAGTLHGEGGGDVGSLLPGSLIPPHREGGTLDTQTLRYQV